MKSAKRLFSDFASATSFEENASNDLFVQPVANPYFMAQFLQ